MTHLSNKVTFLAFYWITIISMASGHYCEWGLCDPWQYCCEDNTCCSTQEYNIYVIAAIVLGISAMIIICCTFLCCNIRKIQAILPRRYFGITYVIMRSSSNAQIQPGMSETSIRENNKDTCLI